jgi:hypothetical protein
MQIDEVPPPTATPARPVFGPLVNAVMKSGQWVRVPLCDVVGRGTQSKRHAVRQAMRQAGIRVRTRTDGTYIYVRLRVFDPAAAADSQVNPKP